MASAENKRYLFVDSTVEAAPAVGDEPRLRVYRWRTYQLSNELVLVCEVPETGRIRVSTAIAYWNHSTGHLVTDSGRVYELVGSQSDDSVDFNLTLMSMGLGPAY